MKGDIEPSTGSKARLLMTLPAERFGVVTRCTSRLATVGVGGVAHHEVCLMEPAGIPFGVTVRAEALFVASAAR
jgi:hypothetical protein